MKTSSFVLLGLIVWTGACGVLRSDSPSSGPSAKAAEPESFQIRNKKFGTLLRPQDADSADGTRIVLYPGQPWKRMTWKLHSVSNSVFQLQNHFTSKTFTTPPKTGSALAPVRQVPFARDAAERPAWRFTKLPDGSYQITEVKSGGALTAGASDDGTVQVLVGPWQDKDEQKWELIKTDPAKLTM